MTTRAEQFQAELFQLLRKYDVEMCVEEETKSYATYASGISFFSHAEYDNQTFEQTREEIDFQLGRYVDGKPS